MPRLRRHELFRAHLQVRPNRAFRARHAFPRIEYSHQSILHEQFREALKGQIHTSNQRKVTNIFTKTILLHWPPPTTPRPISPNEPHIRGRALDTLLICSACTVYASSFASCYSAFGSIYTDGGRNPGVLKSPFFTFFLLCILADFNWFLFW